MKKQQLMENELTILANQGDRAIRRELDVLRNETSNTAPTGTYVAWLAQAGAASPVATVLVNTLGAPLVWTRTGPGSYRATLAGAFPADKTAVLMLPDVTAFGLGVQLFASRFSDDEVSVLTYSAIDAAQEDDLMTNTTLRIDVYP